MPFGRIISFDNEKGHGSIRPEAGGADLGFERGDIFWDDERKGPVAGERLSYAIDARQDDSQPRAVNIQQI